MLSALPPGRPRSVRWILALLAWIVTTTILAPVCFFGVILLAGPHSSVLPTPLQAPAMILGWALFFGTPVLVARTVWRRTAGGESVRGRDASG